MKMIEIKNLINCVYRFVLLLYMYFIYLLLIYLYVFDLFQCNPHSRALSILMTTM